MGVCESLVLRSGLLPRWTFHPNVIHLEGSKAGNPEDGGSARASSVKELLWYSISQRGQSDYDKDPITIAEIGVAGGHTSRDLLATFPDMYVLLVDPYLGSPVDSEGVPLRSREASHRLQQYIPRRARWIFKVSVEAD